MKRVMRMLCTAGLMALASTIMAADPDPVVPITVWTSSGLVTFAGPDRAIRVAVAFTRDDPDTVYTVVKFVDAHGNLLKQGDGEVRDDEPLVVDLTRSDVGVRTDVLVRAVIEHTLPRTRERAYPIVVTLQPIGANGSGLSLTTLPPCWERGSCPIGGSRLGPDQQD
jgi:hypothetical protein